MIIGFSIRSEQLIGINALVDELLDAGHRFFAVSSIGYAKPFRSRIKHLTGGCSFGDEFVDHQGNEELSFHILHVLRITQELLEILLTILEIVRGKAPDIHRYRSILVQSLPLALLVLELDGTFLAQNLRTLNDIRQVMEMSKEKLKYLQENSGYMKDLVWGEKCDNMYEMMLSKAGAIMRKRKDDPDYGRNVEKFNV